MILKNLGFYLSLVALDGSLYFTFLLKGSVAEKTIKLSNKEFY